MTKYRVISVPLARHVIIGNYRHQQETTMYRLAMLLLTLTLSAGLAGCETVKGAGKDIEKAGEAIQRAAK